jgi:hypothetical protein
MQRHMAIIFHILCMRKARRQEVKSKNAQYNELRAARPVALYVCVEWLFVSGLKCDPEKRCKLIGFQQKSAFNLPRPKPKTQHKEK